MLSKPSKFLALAAGDRWLLVLGTVALPLIGLGLRLWRLDGVFSGLDRLRGRSEPQADSAYVTVRAQRTRQLVTWAARHGVYRGNCLSRSLTLWWLLRRQGIESRLRIGVRKEADVLEAHAWIECLGQVLNDRPDVGERLVPFDLPIVPSRLSFH